jgi:hypothetical protein
VPRVEAEYCRTCPVRNNEELPPTIEVDLWRSVVAAETEIAFVAYSAKVKYGELGIELKHLPTLAVRDVNLTSELLRHDHSFRAGYLETSSRLIDVK